MTRLDELRDRIRNGDYRVDAAQIAEALLRHAGDDPPSPPPGPRRPQIRCS